MAKREHKPTLTEAMRTAIEQSGLTRYRIAVDTGILETSISRFMDGKTSLRLDKADALARYLGLQLTADPDAEPPRPTPENLARPMLTKAGQGRASPTARRRRPGGGSRRG